MSSVNVTKANGEKQAYDASKLRKSLTNVGAQSELINDISKYLLIFTLNSLK